MKTTTKTNLLAAAAAQVAQYPQYAGTFEPDKWSVMRAKRDLSTKMGLAAGKGELVLVKLGSEKPVEYGPKKGQLFHTIWSMRNRIATSLPVKHFDGWSL